MSAWTAVLVGSLAALAGCGGGGGGPGKTVGGTGGGGDPLPAADWPQFRRDAQGTSWGPGPFAVAAQLTPGPLLDVGHAVYSQVVAAGGTGYVATADVGAVTAFDLATGATRWVASLDAPTHADCEDRDRQPGIWGAPAVFEGTVYTASPDGAVHALDAATGAEQWSAPVAQPSPDGELIETAVVISSRLGRAYVGVASSAPCREVVGKVAAVDLATHAVTVRALVPAGQRGASVWASPALDEDAGILFVATGVGHDAVPLASVPLAQAVVALDATTLEVKDHWQNPTALTNADFGGSPLLYQAGGRRLLAVTSKDGNAYALDRDHLSAGPVWTRRLAVLDPAHPQEGGDPLAGFGSIASPALAHGLIYVGGGRTPDGQAGGVYALDPASGAVRFVHATPGAVLQAVAAVDGVLLVVSTQPAGGGSTLEVLDASSGAPLRSFDAGVLSLAAPSYASGQVLWPDASGAVRRYAVQP